MAPGQKQRQPELLGLNEQAEHDFLIPEVFVEYQRRVPGFVSDFTDEELVGRANDVRYQTELTVFEDGYITPGGQAVPGIFEPHIHQLVRTPALLEKRVSLFNSFKNDGIESREAEARATQAVNRIAIAHVEQAHDPVVQRAIRDELVTRALMAASSHAPASFERFNSTVVAAYRPTAVEHAWYVTEKLFSAYQASLGSRVPAKVAERQFAMLAALDTMPADNRPFVATFGKERLSVTLDEAKMRLVYGWHVQEVQAGLRFGRTLDNQRIREKFAPLYEQLGYEFQDAQEYVLPSRVREGAIRTGLALKMGGHAVGHGAEAAVRHVAKPETVVKAGVSLAGVSMFLSSYNPLAHTAERPTTSISQHVSLGTPGGIGAHEKTVVLSALPMAFESGGGSGESCADPFKYTAAMQVAVDRIIARGGRWANEGTVLDYFLSKCEGLNASAGIVGNSQAESGTNPTRHQVGGSAYGAFQEDGGRKVRLMSLPGYDTLQVQLDDAWNEMNDYNMVDTMRQASSPEAGAVIFERLFERAGVPRLGARKGYARELYTEFMNEYHAVQATSGHRGAPAPAPRPAVPVPTAPVAHAPETDFSKVFADSLQSQTPAVDAVSLSPTPSQSPTVTETQGLTSAIEQAISATAAPTVPTAATVVPATLPEAAPAAHGDNSPHGAAPLDMSTIVSQIIASREASTVPAVASPESTGAAAAAPSGDTPPSSDQQALVGSTPPAAASTPAPTPETAAPTPSTAVTPSSSPTVAPTPLPATPSVTTPPTPETAAPTPSSLSINDIIAQSTTSTDNQNASSSTSSLVTPAVETAVQQPDSSVPLVASAVPAAAVSANTTPAPAASSIESSIANSSNSSSDSSQSLVPNSGQQSSSSSTSASQPAVILPTLVPATPAPKPTAATPPQSVDAQRSAEIKRLEQSGEFNGSQALPSAPRTPLERQLKAEGQRNGYVTNVEPLGSQWGNASLYAPAAQAFRKMNDAFRAARGHDLIVNDSYRSYARQVATKQDATSNGRSQFAATPGESKHGWGLAIDLGGGMQSFDSADYAWMKAHALDYGFDHPSFADPSSNAPEPWHWEYVLSE